MVCYNIEKINLKSVIHGLWYNAASFRNRILDLRYTPQWNKEYDERLKTGDFSSIDGRQLDVYVKDGCLHGDGYNKLRYLFSFEDVVLFSGGSKSSEVTVTVVEAKPLVQEAIEEVKPVIKETAEPVVKQKKKAKPIPSRRPVTRSQTREAQKQLKKQKRR